MKKLSYGVCTIFLIIIFCNCVNAKKLFNDKKNVGKDNTNNVAPAGNPTTSPTASKYFRSPAPTTQQSVTISQNQEDEDGESDQIYGGSDTCLIQYKSFVILSINLLPHHVIHHYHAPN